VHPLHAFVRKDKTRFVCEVQFPRNGFNVQAMSEFSKVSHTDVTNAVTPHPHRHHRHTQQQR
jgi:hypothetical protein